MDREVRLLARACGGKILTPPSSMHLAPALPPTPLACYVDLLPKSDQQWPTPPTIEAACKQLCAALRAERGFAPAAWTSSSVAP